MKRNVNAGSREGKSEDGALEAVEGELIEPEQGKKNRVDDRQISTKSRLATSKSEASSRLVRAGTVVGVAALSREAHTLLQSTDKSEHRVHGKDARRLPTPHDAEHDDLFSEAGACVVMVSCAWKTWSHECMK